MQASSTLSWKRKKGASVSSRSQSDGILARSQPAVTPATCGHCELPAKRRLWQLQLRARDVELDLVQACGAAAVEGTTRCCTTSLECTRRTLTSSIACPATVAPKAAPRTCVESTAFHVCHYATVACRLVTVAAVSETEVRERLCVAGLGGDAVAMRVDQAHNFEAAWWSQLLETLS